VEVEEVNQFQLKLIDVAARIPRGGALEPGNVGKEAQLEMAIDVLTDVGVRKEPKAGVLALRNAWKD